MNNKNGLTLKQHIIYLTSSILVSVSCFYLDIKYDNLPHHLLSTAAKSQTMNVSSANIIWPPVN